MKRLKQDYLYIIDSYCECSMDMASGGRDQTIPRSGKFLIGIQEGHGLGMRDNIIGS